MGNSGGKSASSIGHFLASFARVNGANAGEQQLVSPLARSVVTIADLRIYSRDAVFVLGR
jgi:hypothetical protein